MIPFDKARDYIREKLLYRYGSLVREIPGGEMLPGLSDAPVFDATVDAAGKFRITVYINTFEMSDDAPEKLYRAGAQMLADDASRIIVVLDLLDADIEPWTDYTGWPVDSTPGLWIMQPDDFTVESFHYTVDRLMAALDGKVWKIGCRQGRNPGLQMVLTQHPCPHCGRMVWVPDHLIHTLVHEPDGESKPWIHSISAAASYSAKALRGVEGVYNSLEGMRGIMRTADDCGFHVLCSVCRTKVVEYGRQDHEWFQHEQGDLWYRWAESETLPRGTKLVPIPLTELTFEDMDHVNTESDCMDGVVHKGEYSIMELIEKPFDAMSIEEMLSSLHSLQYHLMHSPMFTADMKGTLAGYSVGYTYDLLYCYATRALKALNAIMDDKEQSMLDHLRLLKTEGLDKVFSLEREE